MKKLTHTDELFVIEYLKNGQNATKAYLAVRPDVNPRSASVSANRLLKKSSVIEAIKNEVDKRYDESIASREYLIEEAHEIGKEAREDKSYGSAIKAVELKGKLNKVFDSEEPEMQGYIKLMQSIAVNVDKDEAIDVTPEIEDKDK